MCTQLPLDSAEGKKLCISSTTGRFSEENSFFIARRALDRSNYTFYISHFSTRPFSFDFGFVLRKEKKKEKESRTIKVSRNNLLEDKKKVKALFGLINND